MQLLVGVVVLTAISALIVLLRLRSYAFTWGARPVDLAHSWPGDELCPDSQSVATRAIQIEAPASVVWQFVAQLGQDRAGFYSYTWLENLFGCEMPRVDVPVPEWQRRMLGENVWRATPNRYHGDARVKIARIGEREMSLTSPEDWGNIVRREHAVGGAWTFAIVPVSAARCRLVVRSRGPEHPGLINRLYRALIFDPIHFVMERRMMRQIKSLAEKWSASDNGAEHVRM